MDDHTDPTAVSSVGSCLSQLNHPTKKNSIALFCQSLCHLTFVSVSPALHIVVAVSQTMQQMNNGALA